MLALRPDFFVADGDMIYADDSCPYLAPDGRPNVPGDLPNVAFDVSWRKPSKLLAAYFAHWRYNRGDPFFKALLRETPIYSVWDDHEVLNDFGPWLVFPPDPKRAGYPNVVTAGRQAYLSYAAMRPGPMYRSFRWGRDVELFLLDGRSYRSRNDLRDTAANAKTLFGPAQLAWLEHGLARSRATWKVVVSDVTLSMASGRPAARDGFANIGGKTGFERELLSLLSFLDTQNVRNIVFLATDVHYTQFLRHKKDFDGDGDNLTFRELVTGPLAADRNTPGALDPTTAPVSLFSAGGVAAFAYLRTVVGRGVSAVAGAVEAGGYEVVCGAGDAEVLALSVQRDRLGATVPYAAHEVVLRALDKLSLLEAGESAGLAVPRTVRADAEAVASFGAPVVVKARLHADPDRPRDDARLEALIARDPVEAAARVAELESLGAEPLLQELVSGRLIAHTVLVDREGSVVARLQQEAAGTWPPHVGASVRARTVAVDEELAAGIDALVRELGWFGLAELQLLAPAGGRPRLIDLNGRFYGSPAPALPAGGAPPPRLAPPPPPPRAP